LKSVPKEEHNNYSSTAEGLWWCIAKHLQNEGV